MSYLSSRIRALTGSSRPIPAECRASFVHLYWEIAWFGILSGTTMAFLGVYATRQGASPSQIGLLSAIPALVALIFSLPIGGWLTKQPIGRAVFWSSVCQRIFYLFTIFMPVVLLPHVQVWVILLLSFVMTIPGTALTVGFNTLFAEVVPADWRGHVMGLRMALLAIITTAFSFISGLILDWITFPTGYQIVFGLGFLGGAMSTLHLYLLMRIYQQQTKPLPCAQPEIATPRLVAPNGNGSKLRGELNALYRRGMQNIRLDALRGHFARVMGLLFFYHFAQFLVIPTVTPYVVNHLKFSDQIIGVATAVFNLAIFLGSLRLSSLTARWGNKRITGWGVAGISTFPILISLSTEPVLYIMGHVIGGLAWSLAGGATYNYIMDNVPADDRPAHLAWYSVISNAAILLGSLLGPALAPLIGFSTALFIYGLLRLFAGLAILKWG